MSVHVVKDRDSRCRLAQYTPMDIREWAQGAEAARARFHRTALNQRKGNQEAATSIKHVGIESTNCSRVTSEERGAMKTAVKDATLSDTEAIYLASVILGIAWLFV
jgi:hypothetical protein